MSIGPGHRRVLRSETMVATAINGLMPTAAIWFLGVAPPKTLFGANGIVGPMVNAAGLATFGMTMILTAIVRARVRNGSAPALDWPARERGAMRLLPRHLLLRAICNAALALVLFVPAGLLVVTLLPVLPLSRVGFLIFNLVFGAIVGIVMTRFVVLPALADPVGARPSAAAATPHANG